MNRIDTLHKLAAPANLKTRRGLHREDIATFCDLVRRHPRKTVRVYSRDGFVPGAYRYRCEIQRITRHRENGAITIEYVSAQRSHGRGALATVNNRGI